MCGHGLKKQKKSHMAQPPSAVRVFSAANAGPEGTAEGGCATRVLTPAAHYLVSVAESGVTGKMPVAEDTGESKPLSATEATDAEVHIPLALSSSSCASSGFSGPSPTPLFSLSVQSVKSVVVALLLSESADYVLRMIFPNCWPASILAIASFACSSGTTESITRLGLQRPPAHRAQESPHLSSATSWPHLAFLSLQPRVQQRICAGLGLVGG